MPKTRNARRLAAAMGVGAALLVPTALMETGVGSAASDSAAAAQYAPSNTTPPTISGTTTEGQTLTASAGAWSSTTATSYTYQWQRCDSKGANCANHPGSTGTQYTLVHEDVGNTVRVVVTAKNADGSTNATSAASGVIAAGGPAGAVKEPNGRTSVPVSSLALPDRLTIDQVQFAPSVVRSLTTITGKFHVTNSKGYDVSNALVYAIGLPYSRVTQAAEVRTDQTGWATIQVQPAKFFPHKGYVEFFVRARSDKDTDLLAGISTRRLVQLTIDR
jgi:hypothetical protein